MADQGRVYLTGAGPGDPDLITLKAVNVINKAEVIIYDYLVNKEILKHASPDAQLIYVGKKSGNHTLPQEEINQLIVAHVEKGHKVVRLKGGDPFLFGRGGEEAEYLVANNIPFSIIPGITSAIAVPAYAGIPVTHRDFSANVTIVTGHRSVKNKDKGLNWQSLANTEGTLVFLMGVSNLPQISNSLIENGLSPQTPVAIISWGCYPEQKTFIGSLETIVDVAEKNQIAPPSIIVVGEVVQLQEKLGNWFKVDGF